MNRTGTAVMAAALLAAPAGMALAPSAMAQAADPATGTIQSLNAGILAIMRAGGTAGQAGRARLIAPVVDRAFDIALMTRLAVGPGWSGIAPRDQTALVSAFRAYTVARYARNFDGFSGERITIAPQVETRGGDKLVRTSLISPGSQPESLNYRLRQSGGEWKVIDVYYRSAISQLATQRSDFASVLAKGGAPALVSHLNRLAAR